MSQNLATWLELSGDFSCTTRCPGCYSISGDASRMSTGEALEHLRHGRAEGARWLWLGGGEPTLRRDLFAIARAARAMGYTRVKLQTNGMLLSYPDYVSRCVDAGITETTFSIKGATAASHDRLTQTPGCFEHLQRGIDEWCRRGLTADGDILLYRSGLPEFVDMIRVFHARGLERFNVWLFSATEFGEGTLADEVPKIADAIHAIGEALALNLSARTDFITSLHTPPCTVPRGLSACLFHAAALELIVANPGGYRFRLEESPIEGGHYLESCIKCTLRRRCNGLRQDYLKVYGDAEFQPETEPDDRPIPVLRDVVGLDYRADGGGSEEGGDSGSRA